MVALNSGASYEQVLQMIDNIRVWSIFNTLNFYVIINIQSSQ
jgi:hypothetical protein